MKDTEIVKKLVGLEKEVDILRIEEEKINDKICKVIYVSNGNRRVRCIYCGKYTRKVHDKLKPVRIKYLKISGYTTYLEVYKRRFNCSSCGKRFTEDNYINGNKKTISNKTIQNILIDLKEYNLSLKYIAKINNVK